MEWSDENYSHWRMKVEDWKGSSCQRRNNVNGHLGTGTSMTADGVGRWKEDTDWQRIQTASDLDRRTVCGIVHSDSSYRQMTYLIEAIDPEQQQRGIVCFKFQTFYCWLRIWKQ
ncbi:hypothetical protein Ahia01_000470100 [Argonauta hians]